MNYVDIIIIFFLFLGAFKGYKKGFLLEVIAIIALIAGIIGGLKLLHWGMQFLTAHTNVTGPALPYITFIILFIIIILVINLLGKAMKKLLDMTLLGSLDDVIGALIGALKWAFGLSALFWITESFHLEFIGETIQSSYLYGWIAPIAPTVIEWLTAVFPFVEDLLVLIQEMISKAS